MIVTAQTVLQELDILEVKFNELKGVVDTHIVVEARRTYTGKEKPLFFLNSRGRFYGFPVLHKIVDLPVDAATPWDRERAQAEAVRSCVDLLQPDILMLLDADEVPRADVVQRFVDMKVDTAMLEMEQCNFYFNRRCKWMKWPFSKITRCRPGVRYPARPERNFPVIPNAGWHFQNFGTKHDILRKLDSFSHAYDEATARFRDEILRDIRPDDENSEDFYDLPEHVLNNRGRYAHHFKCNSDYESTHRSR